MHLRTKARKTHWFVTNLLLCSHGTLILTILTASLALPTSAQTIGEALDAPELEWSATSGWLVSTNEAQTGTHGLICNSGDANTRHSVSTTITGPVAMSFWFKTDSATNCGYLSFNLDYATRFKISGFYPWQRRSYYLPEGVHTVAWEYKQTCYRWPAPPPIAVWLDRVSLGTPELPVIVVPENISVLASRPLEIVAEMPVGTEPVNLQWYRNGIPLETPQTLAVTYTNAQAFASGDYTLVVSNIVGVVTSKVVHVAVAPTAPVLTRQPASVSNVLGSEITLASAGWGTEPICWHWLHNGVLIPGETNASLHFNLGQDWEGTYEAVASNEAGSSTTKVATVTLVLSPLLTSQPKSQGAANGATVRFVAEAMASGTPQWQWYHDGVTLSASGPVLNLTNVQSALYGDYWAVVANEYGRATTSVAVLSYSPVVYWGESSTLLDMVSPSATNVIAVGGGDDHALCLRRDGTVVTWGTDCRGKPLEIPAEATNLIAIAAGSCHCLGLREDGTVVQWGDLFGGHLPPPESATNVVQLGMGPGSQHGVALRADGTVVDWHTVLGMPIIVPEMATNVVAIAAGAYSTAAVRADGTVVIWGVSNLGGPRWTNTYSGDFVAVGAGWFHFLGVRSDGSIIRWYNGYNSIGTTPQDASTVIQVAGGSSHCLALREDGRLVAWGYNKYQEATVPPWATNLTDVQCTSYGSVAITGEGAPLFMAHPLSLKAKPGNRHHFLARAVGAQPLTYQWMKDGVPLGGQTHRWLVLTNVQPHDSAYSVVASNSFGMATSRLAKVLFPTDGIPKRIQIGLNGAKAELSWEAGELETATTPSGPWLPLPDAKPPFTVSSTNNSRFFRLRATGN